MRTTLTIDSDVAIALDRLREDRGLSLKRAVNEVLRRGLAALEVEAAEGEKEGYTIATWDGGGSKVSLDSVSEALAWGEGETWK